MMPLHGHVLIVDDLESNRDALERMLQRDGLTTDTAADGFQALEKAKGGGFDVILLDVMMPGMDGIQVLSRLKDGHAFGDVPVIMLSALQEAQAVRECIEMGADDFLPKPIDRLLLRARLKACLRRKQFMDKERDYLARLEASNEELHRLNQLKSRFLAIAAHDLKSPMTAVLLQVERLMEQAEEGLSVAQLRRGGQRIQESVQKMLGILQALLDTAALEAGQSVLRKRPTDLGCLALQVMEENRAYAAAKSIQLQGLVPEDGPWMAMVDETRIREAYDNLVNNAIKFSPERTEIRVALAPRLDGSSKTAVFTVKDQGPGLTEDDKRRVFGIYQRLSAEPTGGEASSGLGLSIVKQLVELHEGRVWVESETGRGAAFSIELPLLADAVEPA